MAVALVGSTATGTPGVATSVTINQPAEATSTAGLLLVAWDYINIATTIATPAGWAVWHQQTGTAQQWAIFYKTSTTGNDGVTLTTASARQTYGMLAFSGVNMTTPEDVASAGSVGTTAIAFPAVTPVTAGAIVLAFGGVLTASGVTTTAFTSTNLDGFHVNGASSGATSTATNAVNATGAIGYENWVSGAFTPAMAQATSTSSRTMGVSTVIRPDLTGGPTGPGAVRTQRRGRR